MMMKRLFQDVMTGFLAVAKPILVARLPAHAQIEITTYCNMNCLSCGRRTIIKKPRHMSLDDFKTIFDGIKPRNVNLSGLGEPLLNPQVFEMIRYAEAQKAVVNFPTNLAVSKEIIRRLVESGIDQIKVSIDAATRETYTKVRGQDNFGQVVANIAYINQLKKEKGLSAPELRFNFCLQRHNLDELPALIKLAQMSEIKTIYIQDLNYFSVEAQKSELCGMPLDSLRARLNEADRLARAAGVTTNIDNWMRNIELYHNKMLPKERFQANDIVCSFPWISVFIDVEGNVKPCPVFVWDEHAPSLGNCLRQPFKEIWNSPAYRKLRREFKKNIREFAICRQCVPPQSMDLKLIFQRMLITKR